MQKRALKTQLKNAAVKQSRPKYTNVMIISIAIILIFVLIVVIGLLAEFHSRSSWSQVTPDLTEKATVAVNAALAQDGFDSTSYQLKVAQKMRVIHTPNSADDNNTQLIIVYVTSNSGKQTYLVDALTGNIVMHAKVDILPANISPDEYKDWCRSIGVCGIGQNRDSN